MSKLNNTKSLTGIILGYFIYIFFIIYGYFLTEPFYNIVGALCLMFVAFITTIPIYGKYDFQDPTIKISIVIITYIIFSSLVNADKINLNDVFKYCLLYLFFIVIVATHITISDINLKRKWFYLMIYGIMSLSLIYGVNIETETGTRFSGIFINPNNLALLSLVPLFFIDDENDKAIFVFVIHFSIILLLIYSGTLGALLAYIIALCYRYINKIIRFKKAIVVIIIFFVIIFTIFARQTSFINPFDRILAQANVIYDQYQVILDGTEVNYGYLVKHYGKDALSGIWRLEHWREVLSKYINASWLNIILGHGICSTRIYFKTVPHNEYLRILFEQGLIGIILIIIFYFQVWRRMIAKYKYLLLLFFIFSFSENNIDNFFYMSLLMMFLASQMRGNIRGV